MSQTCELKTDAKEADVCVVVIILCGVSVGTVGILATMMKSMCCLVV